MKDFSKKIAETIKKDHIVPDSKWKTHWRNYAFWLAFSLMILLGAVFFSLVILNVTDFGSELARQLKLRKFLFLVFVTMPYLWLILFLITVFSGFMIFRKTKRGYRYNVLFISGIIVLAIAILGSLAHFSKINSHLEKGVPGSDKFVRPAEGRWQRPEDGLLGGEIIKVESAELFVIKTRKGEDWKVFYSDETEVKRKIKIEEGWRVGIVGEKKEEYIFEAFMIIQPPFKNEPRVKGENKERLECLPDGCRRMVQ